MGRGALNVRRSSENGGIRQGLVALAPGFLPNRNPTSRSQEFCKSDKSVQMRRHLDPQSARGPASSGVWDMPSIRQTTCYLPHLPHSPPNQCKLIPGNQSGFTASKSTY